METKTQTGIWIDASKAVIISFSGGVKTVTEIEADIENKVYHYGEGDKGFFSGSQHISREKTFEERKKHQTNAYLEDIIDRIAGDDEIYIFGPAETKTLLEKKINSEKNRVHGEIKKVETADKMTLNQMVKTVKEFYNI